MMCYSKTSFPTSKEDFLAKSLEYDCVRDTMWWMHSDNMDNNYWTWDGAHLPKDSTGVNPNCYSLSDKDLFKMDGPRSLPNVYTYLQNLTVSTPGKPDGIILSSRLAPLFEGIKRR